MDPIFRLLSSDGEPYRLADNDFWKLKAWLKHPPQMSLSALQRTPVEERRRLEQIRQLQRLLSYNELVRESSPESSDAADVPPLGAASGGATADDSDSEHPPALMFVDDGFIYGGTRVPLTGKPLEFFEMIARSRFQTLALRAAVETIWKDAECQPHAVNQVVYELRKCLKGIYSGEAIKTSGRGNTLAWKLVLPFRLVDRPDNVS